MKKLKVLPITLGVIALVFAGVAAVGIYSQTNEHREVPQQVIPKTECVPQKLSFVYIYTEALQEDLAKNYPNVSSKVKKDILAAILSESKHYDINPLVLYSIIHVESSFQYWIEHNQTLIVIDKKKVQARAVGLGGIMWEWWKDKLIESGICEVRSDLFDPVTNIKATAFVYNENLKLPKLASAKSQTESAILRHFGGNYQSYYQKIDSKIAEFVKPHLYK